MTNKEIIDELSKFSANYDLLADRIESYIKRDPILKENVHSFKRRTKDINHLDDKISRKNRERESKGLELINKDNVFDIITDVCGIRILHLHLGQFKSIHEALVKYVNSGDIYLYENPKAYTWDPEYKALFENLNINTMLKDSFYTSVHYVFKATEDSNITCELQVRTLFEEAWAEIDHVVNYPESSEDLVIKEQLNIFARIVGAATRIAHSIFKLREEYSRK